MDLNQIIIIKEFCKLTKRKFLISNNVKLALKLNLDGVYLPSFNKSYKINNYLKKTNFKILLAENFALNEPEENGQTFEKNALIKARYVNKKTKKITKIVN